jgi:hypothetical protein
MISPGIYFKMPENILVRSLFNIPPKTLGRGEFFRAQRYYQLMPAFFVKFCANIVMRLIGFLNHPIDFESRVFKSVPCGSVSSKLFFFVQH